jgi:quercetin dioxygenase-like cupin family protein
VSQVVDFEADRWHELVPGVRMQPLFGDAVMLNLLEFEAGASVDEHSHPHEQLGLVVDGVLVLKIDGVENRLTAGHGYQIPGDLPHAAWAEGGPCRVLDVFHPIREDYRQRVAES